MGYRPQDFHQIDLMKRIVIGSGVRKDLPKHLRELGVGDPLVIISGATETYNIAKEISDILSSEKYEVHIFKVNSSSAEEVERLYSEISKDLRTVRGVIGVGGGKAIDSAKYIAWKLSANFISVPTVPSHDGIASPFTSLRGLPTIVSIRTSTPLMILADMEIMTKSPKRYLIAGVGDLVGKYTAVLDWRLAHNLLGEYYAEYAASLALHSVKHVLSSWEKIKYGTTEGYRIVVEGLISSGVAMCIAGSTRPASGSEHLFSHALDKIANYPALHGEQVGVGTIMMSYLHGKNWVRIKKILEKLGAPTTAKELGVSEDKIIEALVIAHKIRPDRYTILGRDGLSREAAERLARITGVIS
ncbi:MAG: NAD(P)-dependent glycerol-1-phosphate dehydrogenase [Sulfolobales archaeon]